MHIPKAALAAPENHLPLVIPRHVGNDLAGFEILNHSTLRHLYDQVLRVRSMAAFLAALFSVLGNVFADMAEIHQRVLTFVHLKNNISATSPVSSVRTAVGDVKFPPE